MKFRSFSELVKDAKALLIRRQRNYQLTFTGPIPEEVLRDLAAFCRANETAWSDDPRHHARLQGRQEVWLRIQRHLNLSPQKLWDISGGVQFDE